MIYLDYNATTPVDPRVRDAMLPYFTERFGNAASRHHAFGCAAAKGVERAREQVAGVIGADAREIVWTSGATEANNLALKGVVNSPVHVRRAGDAPPHVITVSTEHKAVLDVCERLRGDWVDVTVVGVDDAGRVSLDAIRAAFTDRTVLVSVMHGNNEIGVLHPIGEIGALCKARGVLFHTDATQSFGKEPIDVDAMGIDLLSASAHKCYGPKGVGLLYVRRKGPRVRLAAEIDGGGHERGARSGTLNVPGIVGMGEAAAIAAEDGEVETARIRGDRDRFEAEIIGTLGADRVVVNGAGAPRLANTSNVSFLGRDGEALMRAMPEIAASTSSACTSALVQPSYVLGAIGCDEVRMRGSVRFSLGRFTTRADLDRAIEIVCRVASDDSPGIESAADE